MNSFHAYIERNQVNQLKLARALGVSRGTVTAIKLGRRRPSAKLAQRIEAVTGIDIRDLLYPPLKT